jgi:hypothetical protein
MARSSGMGVRREEVLPVYFSKREKADLVKLAKAAGMSMVEFVRCKTFDYDITKVSRMLGGKAQEPKESSR